METNIELKLKDGSSLWAEVTPIALAGASRERNVSTKGLGPQDFALVTKTLEEIANTIGDTLEKVKPNKATVEFGIELGIESGKLTALLVKGTGKANLKITLTWEKPGKGA